jgi:hypothetical protein
MTSFSRVVLWLFAVLCVLQLAQGGWARLRTWFGVKFIGVAAAA